MRLETVEIKTRAENRFGFVDLSDDLTRAIKDAAVTNGLAIAMCRHTTCTLLINEWEAGVLEDLVRRIEEVVPQQIYYAHDDFGKRTQNLVPDERENGPAHVAQILLGGASQSIPVAGGEPALGRWQRLILLELDDPKDRAITFLVLGD